MERKYEEKRGGNFTEKEINLLVELVSRFKDILENKKSNAVIWKDKKKAWEEIADMFYIETNKSRGPKMLKDKWENVKRETRKKFAQHKQEMYKTGGGENMKIDFIPRDFLVKDLIGVSVTGLFPNNDSDGMDPLQNPSENIIIEVVDETDQEWEETEENNDSIEESQSDTTQLPLQWKSWIKKASQLKENDATIYNTTQGLAQSQSLLKFNYQSEKEQLCSKGNEDTKLARSIRSSTSWDVWNPAKLKTTKSAALCENAGASKATVVKRKTQLTQDCRIRINAVSEARLDLIRLQMECLRKKIDMEVEEHQCRMNNLKELQLLDIEKKKIELEILKRKLE